MRYRLYKPSFCLFFALYLVFLWLLWLLVLITPSTPFFPEFKVHICIWSSILVLLNGKKWFIEWNIWRNPATAEVVFSLEEEEQAGEYGIFYDIYLCFYLPNFSQMIRIKLSSEQETRLRQHTGTITVHYNKENPDCLYLEI